MLGEDLVEKVTFPLFLKHKLESKLAEVVVFFYSDNFTSWILTEWIPNGNVGLANSNC